MSLNNIPYNKDQDQNIFQEFGDSFLIFDDQQQKIYQQQLSASLKQKKSFAFQQRISNLNEKISSHTDDFIESILFNKRQIKEDRSIHLQKIPSNQESENSQNPSSGQVQSDKRPINKTEMNRVYTKNYRLKKKQELQSLKEENRFLKQKIDDLSFRLREAELQINKLKHDDMNFTTNFNTIKQEFLKEVENILSMERVQFKQVFDIQQKFKNLVAFSNKPRLDLLNYLMSELLQNLVSDQGMYFIQCTENKTGLYREGTDTPLKKLDQQIIQILYGNSPQYFSQKNIFRQLFSGAQKFVMDQLIKIKKLWKKLYQDYIDIINQGLKLQTIYRPLFEKRKFENQYWVLNSLKMRLHFQKNKYRKDIRQIRQSWFKQIQQGRADEQKTETNPQKRCKIEN